jgi:hypothetical protein
VYTLHWRGSSERILECSGLDDGFLFPGIEIPLAQILLFSGNWPRGRCWSVVRRTLLSSACLRNETVDPYEDLGWFGTAGCANQGGRGQRGERAGWLMCRGASSVLATQWKISSRSGRAFARRLYQSFHGDTTRSIDLAIALQRIINDMRMYKRDLQAPYNWAGFSLYGTGLYRPHALEQWSGAQSVNMVHEMLNVS